MPDSKALAVSLLALIAFGCYRQRVEDTKTEEFRFTMGEHTVVEVRIDDGSVKVVVGASGVVEVVFENRARAADRAGARLLLENVRTEALRDGDIVRVKASSVARGAVTLGGGVRTDVTLRVPPRAIELDIRTEDGRVEIEGVSGALVAETGDGRIRVADVDGIVKLRTHDGSITGVNLTGDFDVLSGDGRIRLDGNFGQLRVVTADGSVRVSVRDKTTISNDWSIRTSDGSIELTLPKSLDAKLDATTGDGRIINNLSRFEGTERRSRVKGTLGSGGPLILLVTMDGRISLKES
jgi:nitrogen regulatory protein PII